jgi:uncharacterized protein YdeI (BOF family)
MNRTPTLVLGNSPPLLMAACTLLSVGMISCSNLAQSGVNIPHLGAEVTPIREIRQQSQPSAMVRLQGRVGRQIPILGGEVFELRDSTGQIWVVSPDLPLSSGQDIKLQGITRYQPIIIAGQDQGEVYIELQELISR